MQELVEFFSVFDGLKKCNLKPDDGIKKNIIEIYLKNYATVKKDFVYSSDKELQNLINLALIRLSKGDRKRLSIYKDLSQNQGRMVYRCLFKQGIIKEEESREKPFKIGKNPIKKELRKYTIDSKIRFMHESARFWFSFIAPFEKEIEKGEFKEVLNKIDLNLEKHISLCFEMLCIELIKSYFSEHKIKSSGSFWYKKSEIDLLVVTQDGLVIVGESKWKNSKVCKNVLNSLKNKVKNTNIKPTHFAFFSKSSFSKEMLNLKSSEILLFSLEDFKRLIDDR